MARLLTVEDDPRLRASLIEAFADEGHECEGAADLSEARALLAGEAFDLILLDVMLPDGHGWELLEELRERGDGTRVVFLTARHQVDERVRGLRLGAEDYVVKPFDLRELEARVDVALRRGPAEGELDGFGLALDLVRRRARLHGKLLDLTPKEFEFLACLLRGEGEVVRRDALLREVWDLASPPGTNVLDVLVARLRRKLAARRGPVIRTEKGVGYGLIGGAEP